MSSLTSTAPPSTLAQPLPTTTTAATAPSNGSPDHNPLLHPVVKRVFAEDREYRRYGQSVTPDGLRDFLFLTDADAVLFDDVFARLRWGGLFVYASSSRRRVVDLAKKFDHDGFSLEEPPAFVKKPLAWLPFWGSKVHYFVARKVHLIRPGEFTDRFTYHLELCRHETPQDEDRVVCKRVPTLESVVSRLKKKFPDVATEVLEKRARKFTERIFPTFLTREAAILLILQEHLPSRYAHRVPRVISMEKDIRGFVTSFRMNWLRNGGRPISQLEFALQAADLLRAVHDQAGVIHLDLRLDNMVVTEHGVGFVDFGSAARVGENVGTNPLVGSLYGELMRTSQIQRMLYSMTQTGQVTASHFTRQHGKVDRAIDLFYLAVQLTTPHANPDLAGLIQYDPTSDMALAISELSRLILRPPDPNDTSHRSAKDILRSLELIEQKLRRGGWRALQPTP
jgi:hypothetical protein